jgi:hypothetical protein
MGRRIVNNITIDLSNDSNGNPPLDGQIHIEEAIEANITCMCKEHAAAKPMSMEEIYKALKAIDDGNHDQYKWDGKNITKL